MQGAAEATCWLCKSDVSCSSVLPVSVYTLARCVLGGLYIMLQRAEGE